MTTWGEYMRQVFDVMDQYQIDYSQINRDSSAVIDFIEMADQLIDRDYIYGNITYLEEWAADWLADYAKISVH